MKVISYSLFGFNKARNENCFDFNSYLRGLLINIRMNRLIYPDWEINVQTDKSTYEGWKSLLDKLPITIEVHQDNVPLTLAMLWRLRPVFEKNTKGEWKYTHVLCRDLDSPPTYREAQAVKYWMNRDKTMHAITDSISHDVPLLGGMIGIMPATFPMKMGVSNWGDLIRLKPNYDWTKKGTDQSFLTDVVYTVIAKHGSDSITQHYVLGMPNTFLSDYHNKIQDMELDIPFEYKESNDVCGHIGAAGYYETAMFKFLCKHWDKFTDILEIEKQYPNIFYWVN
jgi:hypothetical protein